MSHDPDVHIRFTFSKLKDEHQTSYVTTDVIFPESIMKFMYTE